MSLFLKIVAAIIVALSALIAIWGNPRENDRLTSNGIISIVLISTGLITAVATEFYQWKEEKSKEKKELLIREFNEEWSISENHPLNIFGFAFYDRHEYTVQQFFDIVSNIEIKFEYKDYYLTNNYIENTFKITKTNNSVDFEKSYNQTVVSESNDTLFTDEYGVALYKLENEKNIVREKKESISDEIDEIPIQTPNNKTSKENIIKTSVLQETAIMLNDEWGYYNSNRNNWCDSSSICNGISTRMNFRELELGNSILSIKDLVRISKIEIKIPEKIDLRYTDIFELRFGSYLHGIFCILSLLDVSYTFDSNKKIWIYSIKGKDLYKKFYNFEKDRFYHLKTDKRKRKS